jgi:hypothetical protein
MYFVNGKLYRIPPAYCEDSLFAVNEDEPQELQPEHPLGGHNYYSGRDFEKFIRRTRWLCKFRDRVQDLESSYKAHVAKRERGEVVRASATER